MQKKHIEIICPVYNEIENVENFYHQFSLIIQPLKDRYAISFLFMDNCSNDGTFNKLKEMFEVHDNIRVIKYSRNYGVMKSIFTGLIHSKGHAVAVFDCDLQDPPCLILEFIKSWESGNKVIYGVRSKRKESFFMGFARKRFRNLETFFKGYKNTLESGAWFLDSRVISELRLRSFEPFLVGLISRLGFKSAGIPYERSVRLKGNTKFGIASYFSYAVDGLVSGTIAPLRLAILLGLLMATLSFVGMIYFLIAKFILGAPFANGVAAIIIITLFSFSINFIFLGIIGEYVGRIYISKEISENAIIDEIIDHK
jgi:glycosyltransferase involved in cell wall biosynthesis